VFYNNKTAISGAYIDGRDGINKTGYINLYELNIDRKEDKFYPFDDTGKIRNIGSDGITYKVEDKSLIYPFIIKGGVGTPAFKTISSNQFTNIYGIGDVMSGAYGMSASITREFFPANHADTMSDNNAAISSIYTSDDLEIVDHVDILRSRTSGSHIHALRTRMDFDSILSDHYHYTASGKQVGDHWDKSKQAVNLVSIPSIFYGSGIKKGSVSLKYFISGTLVGELRDINRNGELIQVEPSAPGTSQGSGNVAGVVMYNEGFMVLTGSWTLAYSGAATVQFDDRDVFGATVSNTNPSWLRFAHGVESGVRSQAESPLGKGTNPSSSYMMEFLGTNDISTVSMMAHARRGELNWSNNPTFISSSATSSYVTPSQMGNYRYYENELAIKNIVSSSFAETTGSFEKTTYISKVGIYDENKKLIAVASIANPVKKTEERDLTFKLKLDI
jgi:hypothetical protein